MEGFIASFERIWVHTKHKSRGDSSLHGTLVKPNSKYFLPYSLTSYPFRFLLSSVTLNLSEYAFIVVCSTSAISLLVLASPSTCFRSLIFILIYYYFIYFISIFILLTRRKATEVLIRRVSNYPNLLPEMPRYCCSLEI